MRHEDVNVGDTFEGRYDRSMTVRYVVLHDDMTCTLLESLDQVASVPVSRSPEDVERWLAEHAGMPSDPVVQLQVAQPGVAGNTLSVMINSFGSFV